jgi:hypothetical protein
MQFLAANVHASCGALPQSTRPRKFCSAELYQAARGPGSIGRDNAVSLNERPSALRRYKRVQDCAERTES